MQKQPAQQETLEVVLPAKMKAKVRRIAKKEKSSMSDIVRTALKAHLK